MVSRRKGALKRTKRRGTRKTKSMISKRRKGSKTSSKSSRRKTRKSSGKKRALNPFFKLMLNAKKHDLPSFVYDGKTYKKKQTKTGMSVYKRA